ncbi:MAG: PAS domain S-box protein, partial [PVC group bacterium]|nr:PAS domain S-box protein [PVC group bacterium]
MKITVGIYLKAIFTVIVIILTVACVLSIFFIHHEKQVIHKSIQERGMALAENFAHNVEYGVLTANSQIISEALYHIMIQPDIVYCRVQDVRGIDLNTEWAEDVYFTIPDDILSASQKTEELLVQVFQLGDKGHYYEISAPVLSEGMKIYQNEEGLFYASETDEASTQATIMKRKIGTVHVGFSMERADSLLLVAQQKIILITGIIIFLAVIATIFLARIAIMPILKIVEGTRRLAAGNLDVKVPVIARDEVGQLADSFNMMTASLKSSREELMSAKKYVEAAIANIIDALFVLDLDGQLRTVNLAACILLEYSEDELLGKPFSELLTSEEKHTASVLLQEINKNGFVRGIELTFVSKMGKYVPVSFSGAKMVFTRKQGEEEVMGIVGIARDMREMNRLIANLQQAKEKLEDWSRMLEQKVDERTQALERSQKATLNMLKDLDETKTYIENIIANFLDTLIVYNPEGIIQKANAATKGLLGYTEDELLGKSIGMICNEDIALHKVLTQGVLSNYEMGYKAKDGKIVPMLFSGSLMCNKSGTPIGIVGMAKDITLRIQAEQSLQEYTQQIEEANKELDDFTYIISHDLKEPLRSINAFSNFILEDYSDRLDEEGQRYLTRIQANSYRMQELIEDLLELSRIDRQKNPVE